MMEALNDFGTVQYFGVDTLATGIYRVWRGMGDAAAGAQLAALLLCIVFLLLALERWSRGRRSFAHSTDALSPLAALSACAAFMRCGAIARLRLAGIPRLSAAGRGAALLGHHQCRCLGRRKVSDPDPQQLLHGGLCGPSLAVCLASILAYAMRLRPTRLTQWAVRVASLGYAIPGPVLAIGILLPFAAIDHALNAWSKALFGIVARPDAEWHAGRGHLRLSGAFHDGQSQCRRSQPRQGHAVDGLCRPFAWAARLPAR